MEISERVKIFLEDNIEYIENENPNWIGLYKLFENTKELNWAEMSELCNILQTVLHISNLKEYADDYILEGILEAIHSWKRNSPVSVSEIQFDWLIQDWYKRSFLWYLVVDMEQMIKRINIPKVELIPAYEPFGFVIIRWIG